jgi:hypothetical protein
MFTARTLFGAVTGLFLSTTPALRMVAAEETNVDVVLVR